MPQAKRSPYPPWVGDALHTMATVRVREWDRVVGSPGRVERAQMAQLRRIVQVGQASEFGRRFGLKFVKTFAQWQRAVPVGDYDSFHPYIERMMAGERDVLVPGFIEYFGNSSGSSSGGRSKFLPIGEAQIRMQQQASADALYRYLVWSSDREFPRGYTVGLFPPTVMKRQGPVWVTSNPALMFRRTPVFSKPLMLPGGAIRRETDYNRKLERIADAYLDHQVHAVSGTTCWFSLLFDQLLAAAARRGRAGRTVADLWPHLRVLFGGGVSAEPYLPVLREKIGHDRFALVDTYNATEGGLFAASDFSGERGMLALVDRGVFFELIALEHLDRPDPPRIPLWEGEVGRNYAIVVSTLSGLYAYKLGDIVRLTSHSPLRLEFAGRLSGCLSTTQELTTHVEIEAATSHALKVCGGRTVDFAAGADVGIAGSGKSRYVLFVEFAAGATPPIDAFAGAFDDGLKAANRVYREHRVQDTAILAPEVVALPTGTVRRFLDAARITSVQGKFPRILSDAQRDVLRQLLAT